MIHRDKIIDQVLEVAERRYGLGTSSGPGWVRVRVGSFLDAYAAQHGVALDRAVPLITADRKAMNELVASLRVGETRFFRDSRHMETIVEHVCEKVTLGGSISVLSAGCSTGEEAYTLAMLLAERGRRYRVVGVDRSAEAIATAQRGQYPIEASRDIPRDLVNRYFENDGTSLNVRSPLRALVSFEARDLGLRTPKGPFHIVVFKNVLLYLAEPMGTHVASCLARELTDKGLLLSAASEVPRLSACLEPVRLSPSVVGFRARREP